jgi:hypothetical protein
MQRDEKRQQGKETPGMGMKAEKALSQETLRRFLTFFQSVDEQFPSVT